MSTPDILLVLGQLAASWAFGFTGGYLMQVFRKAMNQAV